MNTTRLLEIGLKLGQLYQDKAAFGLEEWQLNRDADTRRLEITPPDGWLGKNAEQRDVARDKAFADDENLRIYLANAEDARARIVLAESEIQALEAERRALEWAIRAQLVERLVMAGVDRGHNGDRGQDTAFDDVADRQVADFLFSEPADELPF